MKGETAKVDEKCRTDYWLSKLFEMNRRAGNREDWLQ